VGGVRLLQERNGRTGLFLEKPVEGRKKTTTTKKHPFIRVCAENEMAVARGLARLGPGRNQRYLRGTEAWPRLFGESRLGPPETGPATGEILTGHLGRGGRQQKNPRHRPANKPNFGSVPATTLFVEKFHQGGGAHTQ